MSLDRFHESAAKCDVSGRNILAFVSAYPLSPLCSLKRNEDDEHPIPLPQHYKTAGRSNTSVKDQDNDAILSGKHFVFVCDLNTPWDVHLVTPSASDVTTLKWDRHSGNSLVFANASGQVEVWQMRENLLSEWHLVHSRHFSSEVFLSAFFVSSSRKVCCRFTFEFSNS